jgi:hypothetical protein
MSFVIVSGPRPPALPISPRCLWHNADFARSICPQASIPKLMSPNLNEELTYAVYRHSSALSDINMTEIDHKLLPIYHYLICGIGLLPMS